MTASSKLVRNPINPGVGYKIAAVQPTNAPTHNAAPSNEGRFEPFLDQPSLDRGHCSFSGSFWYPNIFLMFPAV